MLSPYIREDIEKSGTAFLLLLCDKYAGMHSFCSSLVVNAEEIDPGRRRGGHPYFDDNNLNVPSVRANVWKILDSFKTLASE